MHQTISWYMGLYFYSETKLAVFLLHYLAPPSVGAHIGGAKLFTLRPVLVREARHLHHDLHGRQGSHTSTQQEPHD